MTHTNAGVGDLVPLGDGGVREEDDALRRRLSPLGQLVALVAGELTGVPEGEGRHPAHGGVPVQLGGGRGARQGCAGEGGRGAFIYLFFSEFVRVVRQEVKLQREQAKKHTQKIYRNSEHILRIYK